MAVCVCLYIFSLTSLLLQNMSLSKIINENERWLKTAVCVSHHLKNALLQILFNRQKDPNYIGLPEDEEELYKELLRFRPQFQSLIKKKC